MYVIKHYKQIFMKLHLDTLNNLDIVQYNHDFIAFGKAKTNLFTGRNTQKRRKKLESSR